MITQDQVTIIIPHFNANPETRFSLRQCLESLNETVPEIKKIVAVNGVGFEDDFTLLDGEAFEVNNLSFIVLESQGQCGAVNAAIATVDTPYVFVTNNDMVYAPGWFEDLVSEIDDEDIICVSPKLVEPRAGAPTFDVYFCGGAGGDFDKEKWLEYAKNHQKKDFPLRTGFNLPFLISRELWNIVGGYDINFDPWGSNSDSDLEYKIKLAGIQPIQNQNCIVYHFSQTSGTFEPRNQSYWQKNWDYFIEKWGFPRTDNGIWEASFEVPGYPSRQYFPWFEGVFNFEEEMMSIERPYES